MKESNISWCDYQPGTMEGNQARKFLKLSHKLLEKVESEEHKSSSESATASDYIKVLIQFNSVVESCFGLKLKPDCREEITKFEDMYM